MFLMFVIFFNCLSSEWATTPHVSQKTNPWPKIHHKSTRYTFFKSLHPLELSIDIPYRENHWALIDEWLTTTGRFLSIMFGKSLSKLPHFSGLHHVPHFFRNVSYVHLMGIKVPVALLDYYDVLHFDPCVAGVTWVRGGLIRTHDILLFSACASLKGPEKVWKPLSRKVRALTGIRKSQLFLIYRKIKFTGTLSRIAAWVRYSKFRLLEVFDYNR